jgi:cellulose synthase/poly-beta-1,6-N-acetylglucosamine synthase-like glycosyltransferase
MGPGIGRCGDSVQDLSLLRSEERFSTGETTNPLISRVTGRRYGRVVNSQPFVVETAEPSLDDAVFGIDLSDLFECPPALQGRVFVEREPEVADHIANGFAKDNPALAARLGFPRWQKAAAMACAVLVIAVAVLTPSVLVVMLVAITSVIAAVSVVLIVAGLWHHSPWARRRRKVTPLPDEELPTYTVLVPAYREEAVIGEMIRCLATLDYPAERLEVLILVERRDIATQQAIIAADPPSHMRVVQLPPGAPQTKPRSCNAGLLLARGQLLVIFDAEDRPEHDQLRRAAEMFAARGVDLACVQATLLQSNAQTNLFTRCNALEYALRYRLMLPGLATLGAAFPLGGTSNHFRTHLLRELGGWDAWNVSEDADLGMRCRALGYRTDVVDTITHGEAPDGFRDWLTQHTRWHKGYLLTALVHTRRPLDNARRFGPLSLLALLVIVLGTPLQYLIQPVVLALAVSGMFGHNGLAQALEVDAVAISVLQIGTFIASLTAAFVACPRPRSRYLGAIVVYPFLHWVAACRALHQLITAPFLWEKTSHRGNLAAPMTPAIAR